MMFICLFYRVDVWLCVWITLCHGVSLTLFVVLSSPHAHNYHVHLFPSITTIIENTIQQQHHNNNKTQELPEDKFIMGESLDIIAKIDTDPRFGPTNQILPASGRKDIKAWQKSVQTLLRTLQRPRYVATGLLPEFQQLDGRHAFIQNHQLPPYDKPEWKGDGTPTNPGMDMNVKLKLYAEAMASDPTPLIEDLNARLIELEDLLYSEHYCSEGGFSLDDVDLWARLRSITIVSGVQWPSKLRSYMDNLSALGDVPLYDEMAL